MLRFILLSLIQPIWLVFSPIPLTLFSIPDDSTLSIFLQFSTYYPILHCLQLCATQIACLSSTVIFSCFLTLSNICTKTFLSLPFKPNLLNPRDLTIPCQLILNLKLNPTLCFVYCQLFLKKKHKYKDHLKRSNHYVPKCEFHLKFHFCHLPKVQAVQKEQVGIHLLFLSNLTISINKTFDYNLPFQIPKCSWSLFCFCL